MILKPFETRRIYSGVRVSYKSSVLAAAVGRHPTIHCDPHATSDKRQATSCQLRVSKTRRWEVKHSLLAIWGFLQPFFSRLRNNNTSHAQTISLPREPLSPRFWLHRVPSPWTGRPSSKSTARVCIPPLLQTGGSLANCFS